MVVVNHCAFAWDGRELQEQMPHLTLGQVYAGLSYHYDHQDEIDADIEAGERMAEELCAAVGERGGTRRPARTYCRVARWRARTGLSASASWPRRCRAPKHRLPCCGKIHNRSRRAANR